MLFITSKTVSVKKHMSFLVYICEEIAKRRGSVFTNTASFLIQLTLSEQIFLRASLFLGHLPWLPQYINIFIFLLNKQAVPKGMFGYASNEKKQATKFHYSLKFFC